MTRKDNETVYRLTGEVGGVHHEFILTPGEHGVGSLTDNEVCIRGSDVSRRHAVLHVNEHTIRVEDLRSTNGTFVNGVQVTRSDLADGDWLQFGSTLLTLERTHQSEATLAIELNQPPAYPAKNVTREEKTTQLGGTRDRSSRRLALANRVAAAILRPTPNVETALELLRDGLGADAVALLTLESEASAIIHTLAGAAGALDHSRVDELLAELQLRDACDDCVRGLCTLEDEPLLVAAQCRGDLWHALVIAGGELDSDLVPVCELLFRIFFQALPEVSGADTHAPTHRPEPLIFPENHVRGSSPASRRLYEQLRTLRRVTAAPVLITGETGVGKEHIVRILHASSDRADGPLRAINCAAIPADLLESELFGIEAGVATGVDRRSGAFREADGGTLFFDEIGAMPLSLQAKLLRALQNGEIHPVGGRQPTHVDVRIVAATNTDLSEEIRSGTFRSDLYYRLAGCEVTVAPLRERREDIPALITFFLAAFTAETGKNIRGVSVNALEALQNAAWPGNVRQLEHEVRRLVSICPEGGAIESSMLSPAVTADLPFDAHNEPGPDDLDLKRHVDALERRLITRAVEQADGNLAQAARLLGLSRNGLVMKMGRLGVDRT